MNNFYKYLGQTALGLIAALALSSCATWTAKKCQTTNWETQGYSEGTQGKTNSGGYYAQECQKKNVTINTNGYNKGYQRGLEVYCSYNGGFQDAMGAQPMIPICSAIGKYQKGYKEGTTQFCTYDNGLKRGTEGLDEGNMCSGKALRVYQKGYKKGRLKFAHQEVKNIEMDIVKFNADLENLRDKIADKQYQLSRIPKDSHEESVVQLRYETENEVNMLLNSRDDLRRQITDLKTRLAELRRETATH